jgi:Meiotically up-regulated gene 113
VDKDHILAEIRRCADANGGVALGRERFYAETGIRESDWSGKYWVRWNEALGEAGVAANRLNRPLPEDHVLQQLALFVRELGHFPVRGELKLRRNEDRTFPSANTFGRFGNKQETVRRLAEYCASDSSLADVAAICAPLVTAPESEGTSKEAPADADGYVYLDKSGKHYKIGRSNNAGRRFYEIDLQLPEKLTVVHHVKTDDPAGIERYWHERFAEQRANGEWFALTRHDVKAFKRRRQFM